MQQMLVLPSQWKLVIPGIRRARNVVALAGLLSFGCSRPPEPPETLEQISSYLATAKLAGDAWIGHRTPNPFTRNTLRDTRMNIAEQQAVLFEDTVPAVDTAVLRESLRRAKNTLATMEQLVDVANQPRFTSELALLKADADRVKNMSDSLNQSP
jgi:hypothetical protein